MMGRPAPTVASSSRRRPCAWAAARSASYFRLSVVTGRLLASTTCIPAPSAVVSVSVVSSAVRSTRIGLVRAWRATNATASAALARRPPAALASGAPLALAAPSAASRRGEKPSASNTRPLRSISATMRSVSASRFTFAIMGASARPICPKPNSTTSLRSGRAAADLRELKRCVHHTLSARRFLAVHHERQIQLRRPLGRGDHVDPGLGQGGEDAGGDARRLRHAEPHHHECCETGARLDAVDFMPRDLPLERLLQAAARTLRALLRDAEADRVFGRGLRDEGHRDAFVVHSREGTSRDAGDTQHPAARDREQRLLWNG